MWGGQNYDWSRTNLSVRAAEVLEWSSKYLYTYENCWCYDVIMCGPSPHIWRQHWKGLVLLGRCLMIVRPLACYSLSHLEITRVDVWWDLFCIHLDFSQNDLPTLVWLLLHPVMLSLLSYWTFLFHHSCLCYRSWFSFNPHAYQPNLPHSHH